MDDDLRAERRRRHRLYAVGTAVALSGMTLGTMPVFAERTPILVAKSIAMIGAVILAIGRFAPDHFLRRLLR